MSFDIDITVRPTDDLFKHVNGRWLAANEIPDDKARWGAFDQLRDAAEEDVRTIIEDLAKQPQHAGSDKAKIADLYRSFMDSDSIETRGIQGLFDAAEEINDKEGLLTWIAQTIQEGITSLIGMGVDADPGEPSKYRLFVGQAGLGLPDEEYYRLEAHAATRKAYVTHIGRMLELGRLDPNMAEAIMDLETRIASHHWDKVRCRDLRQMYNPTPVSQMDELWASVLRRIAPDVAGVIVMQPSFLTGVAALIDDVPLNTWKAWASWHTLSSRALYLTQEISAESFDFFGRTLNGTPEQRPRWKRAVQTVEGFLGEAVGIAYVERHFPAEAKERMDALVSWLLQAYRLSITELEWMTEATKTEALHKLANFTSKIGFPDRIIDYSPLHIEPDDLLGNVVSSHRFGWQEALNKVDGPIREWEWFLTPQTVNAYYHPLRNEIVFPAAILQPPFFDMEADDATNFGAIGAVIGHEIGHGFDDQGSTCDGEGRLRDWWTVEDRAAFEERTAALVAQYEKLSPQQSSDTHVNGELTLGENIGDLGGLAIAHKAWLLASAEKAHADGPDLAGHSGAQRLFLSWAQVWRTKIRTEALRERMATDPHSPDEFRCNQVVKNIDAFHEAFGTRPGDGLWLAPEERVKIW